MLPEEQTVPAPLIARVKKSMVSHGWGKKKGIVNLSVVTCDWDIPNGYYNQVMKATIKFSKHWLVFTNRNLWFGILAEDGHFENCISCQWWNEFFCGEVYSIQHYVIKFVSDLHRTGRWFSLRVLWFPPSIKLTATIKFKYCWKWR